MSQTQPHIGALQITIIVLTLATAVVHLLLGFSFGAIFILNAIGYLGLLGLLYLPLPMVAPYHTAVRWALIIYTVLTIVAWLIIGLHDAGLLAYTTKLIEVVLIILLFMEGRQDQPQLVAK